MQATMLNDTKRDVIAEAWRDAHLFLRRFAVKSRADLVAEPWIDSYGIEIIEDDLDGAAAQLIRIADIVQIVLPKRIQDYCVRRFAMMHELYHFLKRHPSPSPTMMCKPKWMRRGEDRRLHVFEIGSNAFAGAALLPDFLLRRRCEVSPVSLDVPWQIACEYDVPLQTGAIRFTELSSERCAVVLSKNGVVVWACPSRTFTREIEEGWRLHPDSVAWDSHARGKLDERAQPVPSNAWFATSATVDIVEHSIVMGEHGSVLSMLWAPEAVAPRLGMP